MGNFQGTYKHPRNPWDLKNYRQKADETLRGYIRRFSRQCTELPNVVDADVIGAFLSGTTCESLVKALVWFWLIDETLSANLVYQSDYEIGSTTPSDEVMTKIMTMVMAW